MLRALQELRAALAGTPLGERDIQAVVVPELEESDVGHPEGDTVLAVSIRASELMEAWTLTRDLVPLTGRWPVDDHGGCRDRASFGALRHLWR